MLTPALILALHMQVSALYWPVLWYELVRIGSELRTAKAAGHDGIELIAHADGRLSLLITPPPQSYAEAAHRRRRTDHCVFPAVCDAFLEGPLSKDGPVPPRAFSDADLRLMGAALRGEDWWLVRSMPSPRAALCPSPATGTVCARAPP